MRKNRVGRKERLLLRGVALQKETIHKLEKRIKLLEVRMEIHMRLRFQLPDIYY